MFSLLPRSSLRTPSASLFASRSFHLSSVARSSQGYGSPEVTNPTPKENSGSSGTSDGKTAEGGDKKAGKEGEALPKPNADSKDSSGDQSKPHYVCDTEKSGAKGENGTARLKKAEGKD